MRGAAGRGICWRLPRTFLIYARRPASTSSRHVTTILSFSLSLSLSFFPPPPLLDDDLVLVFFSGFPVSLWGRGATRRSTLARHGAPSEG